MANINVNLAQASLQAQDLTTNLFRVNDLLSTITLPATALLYDAYFQAASGAGTAVTFPITPVWFAVVKNLGPSNITVQYTAFGGAQVSAANSLVLTPGVVTGAGGIWMYVNSSESAGGLSGLTLISSAGTGNAVVMLAG